MNINSYDYTYQTVVEDLEQILYQLINYSSLSLNNVRKILFIIYNQRTLETPDKVVNNLIDTILFHFTPDVRIYNDEKDEYQNPKDIIRLFLNNKFSYLLDEGN